MSTLAMPAVREAVDALRASVADLHAELTRNGLVVWTAGNVSARVPGEELLVIKPSGVSYDELTADVMVVTDFEGRLVEGSHAPSSDTAAARATSTRTCPRSGESCTRTPPTPRPGARAARADPLRAHDDGRRVRWGHPRRARSP